MATLASDLILRFKKFHYSDCPDDYALTLLNDVHRKVVRATYIRNSSTDISLTAGTREYSLGETILRVHEAYYLRSADDPVRLKPIHIEQLDEGNDQWRANLSADRAEPKTFYIHSATASLDSSTLMIGLDPNPDTTTSGGYPIVRVFTSDAAALATSDKLPGVLLTDEVYVFGMCAGYAVQRDPEKKGYWDSLYQSSLSELVRHIQNLAIKRPPELSFNWIRGTNTI